MGVLWGRLKLVVLAASVLLALTAASTAGAAGFRDFQYGSAVSAPTGQKPQSKLWFSDGSWWGVLWSKANGRYDIWRFDWAADAWSDSGTAVDSRTKGSVDALWDGTRLYVTSNVSPSANATDKSSKLWRYSYSTATKSYTLDNGFPVTLVGSGVEALVMDKDGQGNLWVTYTLDQPDGTRALYVRHTIGGDQLQWGTAFTPSVTGATDLSSDDISAIVAFKDADGTGKIGVMWSNQDDGAMYFIVHSDGQADSSWLEQPAIGPSPFMADDHLALRSLNGDPTGDVVAVMKTSLNDVQPSTSLDPLIQVAVRHPDGTWSQPAVFSRVVDNHTRAVVEIDRQNRQLYVFASAPCCSGGRIYMKQTSLDNPDFSDQTGLGTLVMGNDTDVNINNPTSTKQELSSATGLLVEASDDHTKYYLHSKLELSAANVAPETSITSTGPSSPTSSTSASFTFAATPASGAMFECTLDGSAFAPCAAPVTYDGLGDAPHTFAVRARNAYGVDTTPAGRSWTVDTVAPAAPSILSPATGQTLATTTFTVSGSAEPDSTVTIYDGASPVGTTGADSAGQWSKDLADVSGGQHSYTAKATDTAGNTSPASAAVSVSVSGLFGDDFETGDLSGWTLVKAAAGGIATVQTATVASGTYAAKLSETAASGSLAYIRKSFATAQTDLTVRGDFTVLTEGASGGNVPILRLFGPTGTRLLSVYRQNLSLSRLYVYDGTTRGQALQPLPLGTWAHFDVHVIAAGAGASTVTVRMDGAVIFTSTAMDVPTTGVRSIQIGNETGAQAFALAADNVLVP